jgi:tyrosyl-tRNA synthetase
MKINELALTTFKLAQCLHSELEKDSSMKYPKDLGAWGMEAVRLDELKRFLSKLKVELKVFDIEEDEFPDLAAKDLVEVELRSSVSDARKAMDVLRRAKAFPIEKFHVVNLKKKPMKEEKLDSDTNKDLTLNEVKDIVQETFSPNLGDLEKYFTDLKGEISSTDNEGEAQHLNVSGYVAQEWVDRFFGKDDLKSIEKDLSSSYSRGAGQAFATTSISLRPKGDKIEFNIHIRHGLDI